MAILTGSMGEPQEPVDECEECWTRLKDGAFWSPFCALDGSRESIKRCEADAHSNKVKDEPKPDPYEYADYMYDKSKDR